MKKKDIQEKKGKKESPEVNEVKTDDKKAVENTDKVEDATVENDKTAEAKVESEKTEQDIIEELTTKLSVANDKYLRLSAEFDNYRKRTLKEKMELMKTAGEDIFINILPVIDNFERAKKSMDDAKDIEALKDGIALIYNNFLDFLSQRGVKEIDAVNKDFDTDLHEAITKIPAPNKKLKGKVVDVIEKGYYLKEKVIRFSKVVIGE